MDTAGEFRVHFRSLCDQRGENLRVEDLLLKSEDHLLLAAGTVHIAAFGFTGAGIGQYFPAAQFAFAAGGDDHMVCTGADRVKHKNFFWNDINTTESVDQFGESVEIHLGIVMNRNTQQLLYGFHGKARAATGQFCAFTAGVCRINAAVSKPFWNVHPQIARNGQHARRFCDRVNGEEDHRIRARRAIVGLPIAEIQPNEEDVDTAATIPCGGQFHTGSHGSRGGQCIHCTGFLGGCRQIRASQRVG